MKFYKYQEVIVTNLRNTPPNNRDSFQNNFIENRRLYEVATVVNIVKPDEYNSEMTIHIGTHNANIIRIEETSRLYFPDELEDLNKYRKRLAAEAEQQTVKLKKNKDKLADWLQSSNK